MNRTMDTGKAPDNVSGQNEDSFNYGIMFSFGVLVAVIILTFGSYICNRLRRNRRSLNSSSVNVISTDEYSVNIPRGIDDDTLVTFPAILYSDAVAHNQSTATSGCSICLADYKLTDMLRLLPECGHMFHLKCIDPWLRLHPTCPICRNSPLPTPLATPFAGVVPLSMQRT